jgi:hypothetical protein
MYLSAELDEILYRLAIETRPASIDLPALALGCLDRRDSWSTTG